MVVSHFQFPSHPFAKASHSGAGLGGVIAPPTGGAAAAPPAGGAAAAPPAGGAMTPPKPAPEWEAFAKGWEGNWKCETTIPAGSMGPGSPEMKAQVTAKVKKDLGGFWLVGNYDMKKT